MNKVIFSLIVAIPLAMTPSVAVAGQPVDNYSANAVMAAKYSVAITTLSGDLVRNPRDESALINLAIALRRTGRVAEAQTLYRRVLALEEVELDTVNGTAMSSHEVARRGLGLNTQLSSR